MKKFNLFLTSLTIIYLFSCSPRPKENASPPNILFIAIDDLRPELGCYGAEQVRSPNLDRLASEGFLFNRHYVAVPTCGASRYSLLTGMLPDRPEHIRNSAIAEFMSGKEETERPESFVHHLRRSGYYTVGIGKIPHSADGLVYGYQEKPSETKEMPHSWDEFHLDAQKWGTGWNAFFGYADGSNRNDLNKQVKPYEAAEVEDESYPDGLSAKIAVQKLGELKQRDQPFFLGVGFFKPHLPFTAPKKYWDLYEEADMPLTPSPDIPENINLASLHSSGEFNQYALGEEKAGLDRNMSDEYSRKMMRAYYACVSFIDTQVGKLLDELQKQGLADNTIVVVWGDHGWHLGDHRVWGKHTVFERALRSAFMLKIPDRKYQPQVFNEVVSSVDIYPTLMELCGLDTPYKTDGASLSALWDTAKERPWRNTAFSYFRKRASLRTDRYRLNCYYREEEPAIELFDHAKDPLESKNIAAEKPEAVAELMKILEEQGTGLFEQAPDN